MSGGATKTIKKMSKKISKGGPKKATNPGFQAFLDLKRKISEKLNVPNGVNVGKIASAVQKEIKEKHSDISSVEVSQKALELFLSNVSKYKDMLT